MADVQHRRRATVITVAILALGAGPVACGSGGSDPSPPAGRVPSSASTSVVPSSEVTDRPADWEERATDGPEREATLRLLDEAVAAVGAQRSGSYDRGGAFELRVVEPTASDRAVVARLQARTSIPVQLVAVPMSAAWLEQAASRLDGAIAGPAVVVGVDLEEGRLTVSVDRRADPQPGGGALTTEVHELVAGYLAEGRLDGSVAEGVTAEQAVVIGAGRIG